MGDICTMVDFFNQKERTETVRIVLWEMLLQRMYFFWWWLTTIRIWIFVQLMTTKNSNWMNSWQQLCKNKNWWINRGWSIYVNEVRKMKPWKMADFVYTGCFGMVIWCRTFGKERMATFYPISKWLMQWWNKASPHAKFMHCLPSFKRKKK